jgi:SagB-type dehydrogenase family enzyme
MAIIRTAAYAAMSWQAGNLVWDDYLHQRQVALTSHSERLLRWFASWRETDSCRELGEEFPRIARRLLQEQVLIEQHSAEHSEEQRLMAHWGAWGTGARYHHFAARTDSRANFMATVEDELRSVEQARTDPPPDWSKTIDGTPLVPLAGEEQLGRDWPIPRLIDALYARRSTRQFSRMPISAAELGALLTIAAAPVQIVEHPLLGTTALRTSPSAGARTPIEVSISARHVDGVKPGVYHYSPVRGGLELIGPSPDANTLLRAVGGQLWLVEAPVLLIYSAVLARTAWRYRSRRAYRDILIELGHLSQTVLLAATAMGLGAVTATAIRDSELEALLGCDGMGEPVLAVTAVGRPHR